MDESTNIMLLLPILIITRGLRFSKKFFWFGNDALDEKSLALYLKSEKPEIGHHNSAHASQTGKGLLLFAKRVEDKTSPAGILNLVRLQRMAVGCRNEADSRTSE